MRVDASDDPRLADFVQVGDPELLRARGLFVAEGRLVVQRVVEHEKFAVRALLLSDAAHDALSPAIGRLPPGVPVYVGPLELFRRLTGYNLHRGCLALVERPPDAAVDDVLAGAHAVVVLEGVTDPDNVGSVFRSAAALGADAVLLSPSACDPLYRKAIRTSMAATLAVPFARLAGWPAELALLKARGFTIVALTPREPSETLEAFSSHRLPERLALLVGAEGEGLTEQAMAQADIRVRIPMRRGADSLNLAVAAAIVLSHLCRLA